MVPACNYHTLSQLIIVIYVHMTYKVHNIISNEKANYCSKIGTLQN